MYGLQLSMVGLQILNDMEADVDTLDDAFIQAFRPNGWFKGQSWSLILRREVDFNMTLPKR